MARLTVRSAQYLAATLATTAISLAVLPLATRVIGPAEYGTLALAVAFSLLVSAIAQASYGYVLPEHLLDTQGEHRSGLLMSAVAAASVCGLAAALLVAPLAYMLTPSLFEVSQVARVGIVACVLLTGFAAPWLVSLDMLMLEGRAAGYAFGTVSQSVINALATLAFLFLFPLPELALLLGYMAGQATLLVASVAFLFPHFGARIDRRWFVDMRRSALAVGRAGLAETGRSLFERAYLGVWTSVSELGLFAHAQLYRNAAMTGLNAISRATWPVNLREAREERLTFKVTTASWNVVQCGVSVFCVLFALFGREIIGLLTSGKFVEATPIALIFLAALLIQTSAKREQSLLIARFSGAKVSNAITIGVAVSLVLGLLLIPSLGAIAAAGAFLAQSLVQRAIIMVRARKAAHLPFSEFWVLSGLALMTAGFAWTTLAEPSLTVRGIVGAAVCGAALCWQSMLIVLRYRSVKPEPRGESLPMPDRLD